MKPNKLVPTILRAPFPVRNGLSLAPRLVFVASLSLAVGSQLAAADTAITLPDEGELPLDFRCVPSDDESPPICPIEFGNILEIDDEKYLEFTALEDSDCSYTPDVANTPSGAGVLSTCGEEGASISSFDSQILEIDVKDEETGSSLAVEGIYLSRLRSFNGEGLECPPGGGFDCCLPDSAGTVEVTFEDATSASFDYSSDTSEDEGFCEVTGDHSVLVDFGGTRQVASIRVIPGNAFDYEEEAFINTTSVFAAGLETPDVSPDNCVGDGDDNTGCEIQIGDPGLDGGDLRAVISDTELAGNIEVVGGPWRVRDDRPHCQPGALPTDPTLPLTFDGATPFNVNGVDMMLPLVVSDNGAGPVQYFTIQRTSCGISRTSYTGPPVPRTTAGSKPYLDIVELDTDIVPLASVLGFESDGLNGTIYEAQDESFPPPNNNPSLLYQPLMELNVRDNENKILKGVPGMIDEVARDITIDPGSKRGNFRSASFVAWNLVHAIQTDIRAEIDAEIDVLNESTTRYAACVDSSFYYGQLAAWPYYINLYYDYGVYFATTGGNPVFAAFYFDAAVTMIELFKSNLEAPGVSDNFLRCYASSVNPTMSPRLDLIKDSNAGLLPTDVPLNAWGDIISQLEHLSYAIRTFKDELATPPGPG